MSNVTVFRPLVMALLALLAFAQPGYAQEATKPAATTAPGEITPPANPKPLAANGVEDAIARARRTFEALKKDMDAARKGINSPTVTVDELVEQRANLVKLRKNITKARSSLKRPVDDFAARLTELGAAPNKGETEAQSITDQRAVLAKTANGLKAAQKQLDLLDLEAGQLAAKTSELQKSAFVERVFDSRRSVLNPQLWWNFTAILGDVGARSSSVFQAWHKPEGTADKISGTASFLAITAIFSLSVLLVFFVWSKMSNPPALLGQASDLRRIWRAVGGTLIVAVIGLVAIVGGLTVLTISNVQDLRIPRLVIAIGEIIFSIGAMITVLRAILAPSNSSWRLVNLDDSAARNLFRYGLFAAVVFGFDRGASALADITFLPLEFVVGVHALVAILLIIILAKMLSTARHAQSLIVNTELHEERSFYFVWASRFFLIIWILIGVSSLALLFGYVALAHFVVSNTLVTAAMVIMLYLVHHLVDALVTSSTQPWSRVGKAIRAKMGLGDETIRRVGLLLSTITDISVIFLGAPLILALWTITWVDFSSLATQAFFGFKIGDVFVEPSRILLAIVMLVAGIIFVRVLSAWLNRRILSRSTIDAGVQNSISTGVKYTGLILASGFALSAAGLDFSKLAIVAGALSVGIGFGLQSVVSNFVSGLILLAERPIRIGDWISVGAGEGVVKKINVRSTEIETFDRCLVIVPNSSFISDPVQNWSHGSPVGRIKVNIGVGYDSDPRQVEEVLIKCATAHERVISSPAPRVMFMDFGASSLDFQVRVFIDDIGYVTAVSSDLRFAIFAALKDAGIEIPFPQRDINIRDADQLANAFQKKPVVRKAAKK